MANGNQISQDQSESNEADRALDRRIQEKVDATIRAKIKAFGIGLSAVIGILTTWSFFSPRTFIMNYLYPPNIELIQEKLEGPFGMKIKGAIDKLTEKEVWITAYQDKFSFRPDKDLKGEFKSDYIPFFCTQGQRVEVFLEVKQRVGHQTFTFKVDEKVVVKGIVMPREKRFDITKYINFDGGVDNSATFHNVGFDLDDAPAVSEGDELIIECIILVYGKS